MDPKILNIIQLLQEKTISNNAIWSRTSSNNEFKIEFENATITTDNWFVDNRIHYDFVILNENGDTIERITVSDEDFLSQEYSVISKFYDIVKNNYFKVDATINNIINELFNNDKIGQIKPKK